MTSRSTLGQESTLDEDTMRPRQRARRTIVILAVLLLAGGAAARGVIWLQRTPKVNAGAAQSASPTAGTQTTAVTRHDLSARVRVNGVVTYPALDRDVSNHLSGTVSAFPRWAASSGAARAFTRSTFSLRFSCTGISQPTGQ